MMASSLKTALIIFTVIFLVYFPSFFNTFLWDDEQFIYRNVYTTSLEYLPQIFTTNTIAGAGEISNYYRPLTTLSFTIDRLIWGLSPFGFHLTNTLLHAGAAILIWIFMRRLNVPAVPAVVLALIFGLHPLQTEAVTYINSRGDSMYAFFLMLGLVAFTYVLRNQTLSLNWQEYRWRITVPVLAMVSLAAFIASFLAKEIALAGVGVFGLLWLIKVVTEKNWKAAQAATITLGLLAISVVCYLGLRLTVLNFSDSLNFYGEETLYTSSLVVRLLTFAKILFIYFRLLLVPYPLHMERSVELVTTWAEPWWLAAIGVVVAVLVLGYIEWRRKQTWYIWFGSAWFMGFLLPVSGVVPINGLLYEHWLYMPLVGFFLAVWGGLRLLPPLGTTQIRYGLLCALFVVYALLTLRQNWIWRAPIPFYTYTLQFADTARLHNNLAMALSDAGDQQAAIAAYQRAIVIEPGYPQVYYNLGRSYLELGDVTAAQAALETSYEISGGRFEHATLTLIELYRTQQNYEAILPLTEELLERYPDSIELLLVHGEALYFLDQRQEADLTWQQAYRLSNLNPAVLRMIQQLQRPAEPKNGQQQPSLEGE